MDVPAGTSSPHPLERDELEVPEEEYAIALVEREHDLANFVRHVLKQALVMCASLVLAFHFHLILDRLTVRSP